MHLGICILQIPSLKYTVFNIPLKYTHHTVWLIYVIFTVISKFYLLTGYSYDQHWAKYSACNNIATYAKYGK